MPTYHDETNWEIIILDHYDKEIYWIGEIYYSSCLIAKIYDLTEDGAKLRARIVLNALLAEECEARANVNRSVPRQKGHAMTKRELADKVIEAARRAVNPIAPRVETLTLLGKALVTYDAAPDAPDLAIGERAAK